MLKKSGFKKKAAKPMKRTPLKAKTGLSNKNSKPMKRSTIKPNLKKTKVTSSGKVIWTSVYADNMFSKYIRMRDGHCLNCGSKENLTCSHFIGRGVSSTRYDPDNCIALCTFCHNDFEVTKKEGQQYYIFMREYIGMERLSFLEARSKTSMKRSDAIMECVKFLENTDYLLQDITF